MSKKRILFVCLGNICRSPSAEAVMNAKLKEHGLSDKYIVDSAGIIAYHAGEPADSRMQIHAQKRAYVLSSISRPIDAKTDFKNFDYIIGMDNQNMKDLKKLAPTHSDLQKLSKITDYSINYVHDSIPDPYYGGASGFELVLDLLEDACEGIIKKVEGE
jgi:protein-tyrosine phosphatase